MAIETTALGFKKPDGNEPIRDGNDIISANAAKSDELLSNARARLVQVEAAAGFNGTGLELADAVVAPLIDTSTTTRNKLDARYANGAETTAALKPLAASASIPVSGQALNRMDLLCHWTARTAGLAWTQGFSVNEATQEIYVSAYDYSLATPAQWIEVRGYDGVLKSRSPDLPVSTVDAFSEGLPYYFNGSNQLCFILRLDAGTQPQVRTYNYVTGALSAPIDVAGNSKLHSDGTFFYCSTANAGQARLTTVYVYTMASIIAGPPLLVNTIRLDELGVGTDNDKPQGMIFTNGNIITSNGKWDGTYGEPGFKVFNASGKLVNAVRYDRKDFRVVLAGLTSEALVNATNGVNYENEGIYPLADGRIASLNMLYNEAFITIHGTASKTPVKTAPPVYKHDTGWQDISLASGITAFAGQAPQYRRIGNQVLIRGAFQGIASSPASNTTLGTLPVGCRPGLPNHEFLMPSNGIYYWRGLVTNGGNIQITRHSDTAAGPSTWLPLHTSLLVADA